MEKEFFDKQMFEYTLRSKIDEYFKTNWSNDLWIPFDYVISEMGIQKPEEEIMFKPISKFNINEDDRY